jgi:hypothetical protein
MHLNGRSLELQIVSITLVPRKYETQNYTPVEYEAWIELHAPTIYANVKDFYKYYYAPLTGKSVGSFI